jgi:hypothetical protein
VWGGKPRRKASLYVNGPVKIQWLEGLPSAQSLADFLQGVPLLGHKAMYMARVISGPDLQKKVKNSMALIRLVFICVCGHVCACTCFLQDRNKHGSYLAVSGGVGDIRGEGDVRSKWDSLAC